MFWIGLLIGWLTGPIVAIAVIFLLRDVLPPTFFMPSDWDR